MRMLMLGALAARTDYSNFVQLRVRAKRHLALFFCFDFAYFRECNFLFATPSSIKGKFFQLLTINKK